MNKRPVVLALAIGVLVFTAVHVHYLSRAPTWDPVCDHASTRTNQWGTKAFRTVLENGGLDAQGWTAPWRRLPGRTGQLWVLNPQRAPNEADVEALLEWVAGGGTAVILPDPRPEDRGASLWGRKGANQVLLWRLGWQAVETAEPDQTLVVRGGDPLLREVQRVFVPATWRLEPLSGDEPPPEALEGTAGDEEDAPLLSPGPGQVFLRDRHGVVGTRIPHGAGEVILLCDADMVANGWVAQEDNIVLAANLAFSAPTGTVWFDEYHHGRREVPVEEMDRTAGRRAVWAALAALALFFAGRLWRFGSPVPVAPPPRRSALEYVHAFASLYQRGGKRQAALGMLVQRFRHRLSLVAGLPSGTDARALAAAVAARRSHVDEERLANLLLRCQEAVVPETPLNDARLLDLARAISRTEQELSRHDV